MKELEAGVDAITGYSWWNENSRERFIKAGEKMLSYGMPIEEVVKTLEELYFAMAACYGD